MKHAVRTIKKIFCIKALFIIIGLASVIVIISVIPGKEASARPICMQTDEGEKSIDSYSPEEGMVGQTITIVTYGCYLDYENNTELILRNQNDHNLMINGVITGQAPRPDLGAGYWEATAEFDLAGAQSGYYDYLVHWTPNSPPAGSYWHESLAGNPFNAFTSAIVGWGWFGASTGVPAMASPGWESLSCLNSYEGHESGTCADVGGIDYGVGLTQGAGTYPLVGQGWLGEYTDNDTNQANNAPTGWVTYNPAESSWPSSVDVPGTVDGPVMYHSDTGIIEGWGRINTLKQYGQTQACATELYRSWAETRFNPLVVNSTNVKMAQTSDGVLHVVWKNNVASKIYYRQFRNGIWTSPMVLSDIARTSNNDKTDISIDGNDTIHVTYTYNFNQKIHHIACEYSESSQCWWNSNNWWINNDFSTAIPENDPTKNKLNQSIVSDNNRLYLFYEGTTDILTPGFEGIYYSRSSDKYGNGWSDPVKLSQNDAHTPDSVIDYKRNLYVVWKEGNNIIYRKGVAGDPVDWEDVAQISEEGTTNSNPQIAVGPGDPTGSYPHIVYSTNRAGSSEIYYRYFSQTGGWSTEENLTETAAPNDESEPSIAIGNDYRVHVVYRLYNGITNDIRHRETIDNKIWSTVTDITNDAGLSTHIKPVALADSNNHVRVISESNRGLTITNSSDLLCANPGSWGNDWGWISMRGGLGGYDTPEDLADSLGPMASCFGDGETGGCDQATLSCKVCEVDEDFYTSPDDNSPPLYACNTCTKCGFCRNDPTKYCSPATADADCGIAGAVCQSKKACRRSGTDCSNGESCEVMLSGPDNTCNAVCEQCATCNLWGVSAVGEIGTSSSKLIFHGFGWSAGGMVAVDPSYPPGTYDSGKLEIESDISDSCPNPNNCECTNRAQCVSWGWLVEDPPPPALPHSPSTGYCIRSETMGVAGISGWGVCRVQNSLPNLIDFNKRLPITEEGNYYLTMSAIYDSSADEQIKIYLPGGRILNAVDLSNPVTPQIISCTFSEQVHLKPSDKIHLETIDNGTVEMDYLRVTSLPVEPIECETGGPLTTAYSNEVGFGFVDFSNVTGINPWVKATGDVYSGGKIEGGKAPGEAYNVVYIVETSEEGGEIRWNANPLYTRQQKGTDITLPTPQSGYKNVLGRFDYEGAIKAQNNEYASRVIEIPGLATDSCSDGSINWSEIDELISQRCEEENDCLLDRTIIHIGTSTKYCSLTIDEPITFINGSTDQNGSGTIIVEGDLIINEDIVYDPDTDVGVITELASVAWVVKGDVKIDGTVGNVAGTYLTIGCMGAQCPGGGHDGTFDTGTSDSQLTTKGIVLAKKFNLLRTYASASEPSEYFWNDGRLQANPPPSMVDASKIIPTIITVKP
ncbi:MAG: hypothetical protein PHH01_03360 [Patescibacteria group bacterium]|nr:hypothetical protein [Patescibacteria group bacterium]